MNAVSTSSPSEKSPPFIRSYRMRLSTRCTFVVAGALFAGLGAYLVWGMLTMTADLIGWLFWIFLCLSFLLFSLLCFRMATRRFAVMIHDRRLVVPWLFKHRVFEKDEIVGYRRDYGRDRHIKVTMATANGGLKERSIYIMFKPDPIFFSWFADIPDLDRVSSEESLRQAQEDPRLGTNPEERLERLERIGTYARLFNFSVLPLMTWGVLYPKPYGLLVLLAAAIPPITIWLCRRYPSVLSLDNVYTIRSIRQDLSLALIAPGLLLFALAWDVHLVEFKGLIVITTIGTALLAAVVIHMSPVYRANYLKAALITLALAPYSAGVARISNKALDTAPPTTQLLTVESKRFAKEGKAKHIVHYVKTAAPAPYAGSREYSVAPEVFNMVQPGGHVCYLEYPGRWRMAWYEVDAAKACVDSGPKEE